MRRLFCFSSRPYRKSLALLLAVTFSGCTTSEFGRFPKAYPGPRLPETQVAELIHTTFSRRVHNYWFSHFDGYQTVEGARPLLSKVNPVIRIRDVSVLEMLSGPHKVGIGVHWSNGFEDNTDLDFSAVGGKKYTLAIYELSPGEDPATVELSNPPQSFLGPDTKTALTLLLITLPLWLPFAIYEWSKEPEALPKERPFNGCCFVWIQDEETAEVIAGVSPKSVKSETNRELPSSE